MTVIDGSDMVLGRLCTNIAKRILKREVIHVVNAEKVVVTGRETSVMPKFRVRMKISPKGNPHKGPKYSRMPDRIVKRAVRGMLPWKTPTGKSSLKNLRVHIGVPAEFVGAKMEQIEDAKNRHETGFMTVGEISKKLGAVW